MLHDNASYDCVQSEKEKTALEAGAIYAGGMEIIKSVNNVLFSNTARRAYKTFSMGTAEKNVFLRLLYVLC